VEMSAPNRNGFLEECGTHALLAGGFDITEEGRQEQKSTWYGWTTYKGTKLTGKVAGCALGTALVANVLLERFGWINNNTRW